MAIECNNTLCPRHATKKGVDALVCSAGECIRVKFPNLLDDDLVHYVGTLSIDEVQYVRDPATNKATATLPDGRTVCADDLIDYHVAFALN